MEGARQEATGEQVLRVPLIPLGALEAVPPEKATAGASGMDLRAALPRRILLRPGQRAAVGTGMAIELPPGYEAQVRPRSGLALHHGIGMLNAPGTIDSDYRGEIRVILVNMGQQPFWVEPGERIAQLIVQKSVDVEWVVTTELTPTPRGEGGFGHTGR